MTREKWLKFAQNVLKFTAPGLAVFFYQLQVGSDWKLAQSTALLVLWGLLFDFFSKYGDSK